MLIASQGRTSFIIVALDKKRKKKTPKQIKMKFITEGEGWFIFSPPDKPKKKTCDAHMPHSTLGPEWYYWSIIGIDGSFFLLTRLFSL